MTIELFFNALKNSDNKSAETYINDNPSYINSKNEGDETPLIIAATNGNERMVSFLLSKNADVNINVSNNSWLTALNIASVYGYKKELTEEEKKSYKNIMYKLIESNANLYLEDTIFGTLLMMECSKENPDSLLIDKLIEYGGEGINKYKM